MDMKSAKAVAKKHPAKVYGTMLTLGVGMLTVASGLLTAEKYLPAAALGAAGAALLYVREKL